ncbi:MAG: hypothetical protein KAQ69_06890 [Spirochaetales bacterium]|nr:hypothetical protein [Spirochaetales bacterium]
MSNDEEKRKEINVVTAISKGSEKFTTIPNLVTLFPPITIPRQSIAGNPKIVSLIQSMSNSITLPAILKSSTPILSNGFDSPSSKAENKSSGKGTMSRIGKNFNIF